MMDIHYDVIIIIHYNCVLNQFVVWTSSREGDI